MKKLLLISFLGLWIFTSCAKKYCWRCQLSATSYYPTKSTSTGGTTSVCDKTEVEIRQLEKEAFSAVKTGNVNDTTTVVTELTCNK